MLKKIKSTFKIIRSIPHKFGTITNDIDAEKILTAKVLINIFPYSKNLALSDYEFKVFSQWGDDGIIQYLITQLDLPNRSFIEFGVENYSEANTRFLLINNNWQGLILDGSESNIQEIINSNLYWKFNLTAKEAFITAENINIILQESRIPMDPGILSIDIDGNDYWVWKAITEIKPIIVISEYNSVFGIDHPWTIPYKENFIRNEAHFSNLYYGSSLLSLCDLAEEKGYYFIGCNSAGNNAYFIRKDKIGKIRPLQAKEGYVCSQFRESKNEHGQLSYLTGPERLASLKGLRVFNTRNLNTEII